MKNKTMIIFKSRAIGFNLHSPTSLHHLIHSLGFFIMQNFIHFKEFYIFPWKGSRLK